MTPFVAQTDRTHLVLAHKIRQSNRLNRDENPAKTLAKCSHTAHAQRNDEEERADELSKIICWMPRERVRADSSHAQKLNETLARSLPLQTTQFWRGLHGAVAAVARCALRLLLFVSSLPARAALRQSVLFIYVSPAGKKELSRQVCVCVRALIISKNINFIPVAVHSFRSRVRERVEHSVEITKCSPNHRCVCATVCRICPEQPRPIRIHNNVLRHRLAQAPGHRQFRRSATPANRLRSRQNPLRHSHR